MNTCLDVEMGDVLEQDSQKEKKGLMKPPKNDRSRSISQSVDYNNVILDLDLMPNQNEMAHGINSNKDSVFSGGDYKNCDNSFVHSKKHNEESEYFPHTRSQPRTITRPPQASLGIHTPMSSLLLSTSLSLHDNRPSHVGPEEFIELLRKKQDTNSAFFYRTGNRRRTVSENQASLSSKYPNSLRLKFISETKHSIRREPSISKDVTTNQPINKDLPRPITKESSSHSINRNSLEQSTSLHLPSRTFHPPPSLFSSDSMGNFPKLNVGSPTSPYSDLLYYGRSPSDHLILWKEANKRNKIIKLSNAEEESIEEEEEGHLILESILDTILRNHNAYDVMDVTSRVVILDLDLTVGSAFDALAYDGIHAAPLWDSTIKKYVGMLTMTDFIVIIQHYIDQPDFLSSIRHDPVRKWRDYLIKKGIKEATALNNNVADSSYDDSLCMGLTISCYCSLYQLANHLIDYNVHRVLVTDPQTSNPLHIATHRKILNYMWKKLPPLHHKYSSTHVFDKCISQLPLGTFDNLVFVTEDTPVNEAFTILINKKLSAVPVVNENFQVVNIFLKIDVMSLITDGSFNDLYKPLRCILSYNRNGFEGLYSCKRNDRAYDVITCMVHMQLHRIMVLDREGRLEGVITVSDVVRLILNAELIDVSEYD